MEEQYNPKELRDTFPYQPFVLYWFGEAVSYPFQESDGSVWIYARSTYNDPTSARYVPLNHIALQNTPYNGKMYRA